MVFNRGKLFFYVSKYLRKFRETQRTYIVHINEFQYMVMFKILAKPLKNPFWTFQAFEIFTKEILSIKSKKILSRHLWRTWSSCQVSWEARQGKFIKAPQFHLCPFPSLNNFALSSISNCSQTWYTCSNHLVIHLCQVDH